jgi:hypothetical protein
MFALPWPAAIGFMSLIQGPRSGSPLGFPFVRVYLVAPGSIRATMRFFPSFFA